MEPCEKNRNNSNNGRDCNEKGKQNINEKFFS